MPGKSNIVGGLYAEPSGTVSDDQNRKSLQQWRHARIDRFIRRQRAVHEWINFGEVADFSAREAGSIAPNEVNRALAFEALADALIKGEFDRNGRPHVGLVTRLAQSSCTIAAFCVPDLIIRGRLACHGKPEIFNTAGLAVHRSGLHQRVTQGKKC
jgi:hypothetical protein